MPGVEPGSSESESDILGLCTTSLSCRAGADQLRKSPPREGDVLQVGRQHVSCTPGRIRTSITGSGDQYPFRWTTRVLPYCTAKVKCRFHTRKSLQDLQRNCGHRRYSVAWYLHGFSTSSAFSYTLKMGKTEDPVSKWDPFAGGHAHRPPIIRGSSQYPNTRG